MAMVSEELFNSQRHIYKDLFEASNIPLTYNEFLKWYFQNYGGRNFFGEAAYQVIYIKDNRSIISQEKFDETDKVVRPLIHCCADGTTCAFLPLLTAEEAEKWTTCTACHVPVKYEPVEVITLEKKAKELIPPGPFINKQAASTEDTIQTETTKVPIVSCAVSTPKITKRSNHNSVKYCHFVKVNYDASTIVDNQKYFSDAEIKLYGRLLQKLANKRIPYKGSTVNGTFDPELFPFDSELFLV